MSAYCFFNNIIDPAKLEPYKSLMVSAIKQYGGRCVVFGGQFKVIEGDWSPMFPVIIEFPSLEQAYDWYDSDEYQNLKKLRLSAIISNAVFLEGV